MTDPIADALAKALSLLRGFLTCPEIADCAPEDLDQNTRQLEKDAREALAATEPKGEG